MWGIENRMEEKGSDWGRDESMMVMVNGKRKDRWGGMSFVIVHGRGRMKGWEKADEEGMDALMVTGRDKEKRQGRGKFGNG